MSQPTPESTIAAPPAQSLWATLATAANLPLYAIADGAANAYIHANLQAHEVPHVALYQHKSLPEEQSPWLFPLTPRETFSEWYIQESLSQYWGIVLACSLPLAQLAEHFMSYLTMQDAQGKLHLMRFYDPRVIKAYLDALTDEQRHDFFKPGLQFWADAPGLPQRLMHYYLGNSYLGNSYLGNNDLDNSQANNPPEEHSQSRHCHYRRTLIDLRVAPPASESESESESKCDTASEDCAC